MFCTAVTLLLVFICRWDDAAAQQRAGKGSILALLRNPGLLLVSFACLLYMGQQSAVNLWIASYVETELNSAAAAGASLTLYWTGVMLGRFLQSALSRRVDPGRWLCVCCTISAAMMTAALLRRDAIVLTAVLCIGAVLTGAAFPSMMAMGCACCPEQAGRRDLGGLPRLDDRRHGHPAAGRSSGGADLVLRGDLCDPGHAGALLARADGLQCGAKIFPEFCRIRFAGS